MQTVLEVRLAPDSWRLYSLENLKLETHLAAAAIAEVYRCGSAELHSLAHLFVQRYQCHLFSSGEIIVQILGEKGHVAPSWPVQLSETRAELFDVPQELFLYERAEPGPGCVDLSNDLHSTLSALALPHRCATLKQIQQIKAENRPSFSCGEYN